MAIVIGESGAWKEIGSELNRLGFSLRGPGDLELLIDRLREQYPRLIEQRQLDTAQRVASKLNRISALHSERGIVRRVLNGFHLRKLKKEIVSLRADEMRYIERLHGDIHRLEALSGSAQWAGAQAELEVIDYLSRLPDSFVVFNDLRLTASRFIRFNDVPLQSAQIDHLVLSSAGVFVIETKRWSDRFIQAGDYHNPFDQVQRASYLCFDQLRTRFGKVRVRSVIACRGQMPEPLKESQVKVLTPNRLVGYISWFKQNELTHDRFVDVREYLRANK